METRKYKFINETKIKPLGIIAQSMISQYVFANEPDWLKDYKELVIEEKPTYDEETQELYSWFEDGEVITQKFKVVDKRGKVKIIEKEKPNKRYVCIVYVFLVISVLALDILCAVMNMDVIVAHRIYPFEMEDTNIEGIFVAGDVRSKKVRQLTTAVNDGTIAAIEAMEYIDNLK